MDFYEHTSDLGDTGVARVSSVGVYRAYNKQANKGGYEYIEHMLFSRVKQCKTLHLNTLVLVS